MIRLEKAIAVLHHEIGSIHNTIVNF